MACEKFVLPILVEQGHACATDCTTAAQSAATTASHAATTASTWWLHFFQRMEEKHQFDRQTWQQELERAKNTGSALKNELRESIEHRIAWLEDKLLRESNGILPSLTSRTSFNTNAVSNISRTSTCTTQEEDDDTGIEYESSSSFSGKSTFHKNRSRNNQADSEREREQQEQHEQLLQDPLFQALAGIEINYESAVAMRRLNEIDRKLKEQNQNQGATSPSNSSQGIKAASAMKDQLAQTMQDVDDSSISSKTKQWKEKMKIQKKLLDLLEQQHNTEKYEWKLEKERMEVVIAQLSADKVELHTELKTAQLNFEKEKKALEKKMKDMKESHETVMTEMKELKKQWDHEKGVFENTVAQLTADKQELRRENENLRNAHENGSIKSFPMSPQRGKIGKKHQHTSDSSYHSALSPRNRVEWDDKLDRAMAERDLYKQEAERAQKELVKERQRRKSPSRDSDVKRIVKEKERDWAIETERRLEELREEYSDVIRDLERQRDAALEAAAPGSPHTNNEEMEKQIQQVREGYLSVIEDLERRLCEEENADDDRYKDSVEKRNELVSRLKQMEQQRNADRDEWKLKLEGALHKAKKEAENREALEKELQVTKERYQKEIMRLKAIGSDEELHAKLCELEEAVDDLEKELVDAQRQKEIVEVVKNKFEKKAQKLEEELKKAHSHQELLEEMKENYKSEAHNLEKRLNEYRENQKEAGRDNLKAQGKIIDELEQRVREADQRNDKLERQLQEAQRKNSLLEEQSRETHRKIEELEAVKWKHEQEHKMRASQTPQISDLQSTVHGLETELASQNEKMIELQNNLTELEAQMYDLENELADSRQQQEYLEGIKEKYEQDAEEWAGQLSQLENELDEISILKQSFSKEKKEFSQQLEASKTEIRVLQDKTNELEKTKESLERQVMHLEAQRTVTEKVTEDNQKLQVFQTSLFSLMEGLREDVATVREKVASNCENEENANVVELRNYISQMHNSLNETLVELTLEVESMMEVKKITEEVAAVLTQESGDNKTLGEQQARLLSEIGQLRTDITGLCNLPLDIRNELQDMTNGKLSSKAASLLQDAVRQELVSELQLKETEIARLKAELTLFKEQLEALQAKLKHAESEVSTLNDQADGYSDELMRMQALNTGLEEALRMTERRMELALREVTGEGKQPKDDDTSPLLEEALALAQGISALVHGKQEETNVMDLLQSMSDLMEQQERDHKSRKDRLPLRSPRSALLSGERQARRRDPLAATTPNGKHFKNAFGVPDPIATPSQSVCSSDSRPMSLQSVVESLYGRCQLLERERTQMMETTLDLLESARDASSAELEAALATARRQAIDDMARIRQRNEIEKERLYERLCNHCVKGLLKNK